MQKNFVHPSQNSMGSGTSDSFSLLSQGARSRENPPRTYHKRYPALHCPFLGQRRRTVRVELRFLHPKAGPCVYLGCSKAP